MNALLTSMVVVRAKPGSDCAHLGILLTGANGNQHTLMACKQRTAISWLESMDMMLALEPNVAVRAKFTESGHLVQMNHYSKHSLGWAKGAKSKLSD
jgi:hypothetical protein